MTHPVDPEPLEPSRSTSRNRGSPDAKKFGKAMDEAKPLQEVEKISEVEYDKPKKRAFSQPQNTDDLPRSSNKIGSSLPKSSSYTPTANSSQLTRDLSKDLVPSPRNPSIDDENDEEASLPQSSDFWNEVGLPDQESKVTVSEETPHGASSSSDKKTTEQESSAGVHYKGKEPKIKQKIQKSEGPFSPTFQHHQKGAVGKMPAEEVTEAISPMQGQKSHIRPTTASSLPTEKAKDSKGKTNSMHLEESSYVVTGHEQKKGFKEKEKERNETDSKTLINIPDPLPPFAQQAIQSTQSYIPPYMSPQTQQLFQHMVGMITYIAATNSGIDKTEILLNASSMRGNLFFGTKITIEQYATAPDSFNIFLTGSPSAVKVFQANIDSLSHAFASAYADRRVSFRVGRLEASYEADSAKKGDRRIVERKKGSEL